MFSYAFRVPDKKRVRIIIHSDAKNEADDQYAIAHALMTPGFDIRGIVAGHFNRMNSLSHRFPDGQTARAGFDEILKILDLMDLSGQYPVYLGAERELADEKEPARSDGADFIVEEAMKDDERPLYIFMQGAITDLASAILMNPEICSRMTAIWVGGGNYPDGGQEFNLAMDPIAANVVFASKMPLWQIPMNAYKQMAVSLTELQAKVLPCGAIGKYLFEQMAELNEELGDNLNWPHGEIWGLGDNSAIAVLLEEREKTDSYDILEAPRVDPETFRYIHGTGYRKIRVYHTLNDRLTLEDLFCKLRINYGNLI